MADSHRLSQGERVASFEVVRFLKRGGMGELYEARDARDGGVVALKVMSAHEPLHASRFDREGRVAEMLEHPHIVRSLGRGRTDGDLAWLAMELLAGEDLESRLARGALTIPESITLATQVCGALAYAHGLGVVHRDIKPSNLFLLEGPRLSVKVLDFGLAHLADGLRLTRTDVPVGTPVYMSPEQARGERGVDHRTDLWSLGVVLYECLTGRKPFSAQSLLGVLYQILEAVPARLDTLCEDVPEALADLVAKAIEKSPDARFESARTMGAALAALAVELASVGAARSSRAPPPPATYLSLVETVDSGSEVRLASVVLLHEARDPVFVDAVARELGGRVERIAGERTLVLFGLDRWSGDEPLRALRFARTVAPSVQAAGVATGRVLRGAARVLGAAIDTVAQIIRPAGVTLDATTAEAVRAEVALARNADGTASLDALAPRTTASMLPDAYDTPFVGREGEVAELLDVVEAAWDESRPRGVALTGVAGVGKSRLRHEAARRLAERVAEAICVHVRCDPFRRDVPFGVLREAFALSLDTSVAGLFETSGEGDPTAALDRVRASLVTLLRGATARAPVVLVFDDAQWLDAASRATVQWLRENHPDLPFVVWAFAAPGAPEVTALAGADRRVELGPLSPSASRQLLRAITGDAPEAALERAGGHPLFLEEIGRILARREADVRPEEVALPLSVEGACLAQLDRVAPEAREFLKRAAVFGRTFWVEGVAVLGGAAHALRGLQDTGLVLTRGRSRLDGAREVRFRIGVLQEVALELIPAAPRARLHAHAARWLSQQRGATPDEVALHWERAGEHPLAAEAYARATEGAAKVADTDATCAHAARVLALTQDPELRWRALAARDDVLQLTDRLDLAREGLAELDALARAMDLRRQTEAAWRRAYFARLTYDRDTALGAGGRALDLATQLGDARWMATVRIDLAMVQATRGELVGALTHALAAREAAGRTGDPWVSARAVATVAFVRAEAGDVADALGLYEHAADGFARAGDRRREALMRANRAWALLRMGRVAEAEREAASAVETSQRVGNAVTVASCTHLRGILRRVAGDWGAADELQVKVEGMATRRGNTRLVCAAVVERAYAALARGGDVSALVVRAAALAERAAGPALAVSVRALSLRERRGTVSAEELDAARGEASAITDAEGRAELRAAIWDAGGRGERDRAALDEAIEGVVARAGEGEEREERRAVVARRYEVPAR